MRAFAWFCLVAAAQAATVCPNPQTVTVGVSLEDLAKQYLGDPGYAISIALATNARTADGFTYISNLDAVSAGARVCVPATAEARHLRERWQSFEQAVDEARMPRGTSIDTALVPVPPDRPVTVVAWMRTDQVARLKTAGGGWVGTLPSDVWVTVEPHLREFCRSFVHDHRPDDEALIERIEQRLGLGPASSKTYFVRFRIDRPVTLLMFRPCPDPDPSKSSCSFGPPSQTPPQYPLWFLSQYYSSYGQSLIGEFPWTALGYTFDWAPASRGASRFERFGESEFVARAGAPVEIEGREMATADYCADR